MKRIVNIFAAVMTVIFMGGALAQTPEAGELRQKLSLIEGFKAEFTQTVTSSEAEVIHQGLGFLSIAKPGKLRWVEIEPEQDEIISDGQTIWYYSPFVEQVSIYNTTDAIADTPFILLADQSESLWEHYRVSIKDHWYWVSSLEQSNQPLFALSFTDEGSIAVFAIVDTQGQRSEFVLSNFQRQAEFDAATFVFTVPDGIAIDDQR
jgi:outer membrane lipoprotein carrier protein